MPTIIIALVLAALAVTAALQIDDDLNPDAKKLIEQAAAPAQSEAYFYLMGLDAPADKDPLEAGKVRFEALRAREQTNSDNAPEPGNRPQLPLPAGEVFCGYREDGCLEKIFSSPALDDALDTNIVLLQRYQHFLPMSGFRMLTQPTVEEVYPSYQHLVKGNRLVMLRAIRDARNGEPKLAIDSLSDNLSALRSHLQQADSLIGKMVYATLISETIDVLSVLSRAASETVPPIKPMAVSERSLHSALAREFAMIANGLARLDRNPEIWNKGGGVPGWVVRLLFKPNMSINAIFPIFHDTVALSAAQPQEFAHQIPHRRPFEPKPAHIRNYMGTVLNKVAIPGLETYAGRLFDIDVKIALFNQTIDQGTDTPAQQQLTNPYYGQAEETFPAADGKRICMKGPLEDKANHRCLLLRSGSTE